jgi:brefeldin A-resistance guanine nucleotide exchange factor 1
VSELCLELLYCVLLRNRDRISSLWPRVYDHCQVGSYATEQQPCLARRVCCELSHACLQCTGTQSSFRKV